MVESNVPLSATPNSTDPVEVGIETIAPQWGANAPRGAKAVLARVVKEGSNVPLFIGQTLVNSLRDTGYNNTTSAVCEHVDNAFEGGATEVRVFFVETGRKDQKAFHVLILDNGVGMTPNILKAACAFGGSMRFDNRGGIGRYGMGMKAAALSISPVLDVYSWQEKRAYYNITLDVNAIGQDKANVIYVPNPQLLDGLPTEVVLALTSPASYPKHSADSQELVARDAEELGERLGNSGTIVYMPDCDRLTYRKVQTLVDHATKEMARVYRRQLGRGLKLFINNREVQPFDPTYQMSTARHNFLPELAGRETKSRLMNKWEIPIPVAETSTVTSVATVRLFYLPISDWSSLPRKVLKNDLKVFDSGGISFMRGDREVDLKGIEGIVGKRNTRDSWWRIEIDFHGDLDEAFGVAMNKQGVRPKSYVQERIREHIQDDLREVRKAVEKHWSEQAAVESVSHVTAAERRASEMEALQSSILPRPVPKDEAEQKQLDDNLRALAVNLKREGEDDTQAFERVKGSQFITNTVHNEDAPFYRVDFKLGKVILTINTAHAFYTKMYMPLATVAKKIAESNRGADADTEQPVDSTVAEECSQLVTTLQLFLLSLARTQSEMTVNDAQGDTQKIFDKLRRQWSLNLETQLSTP